MTQESKPVDLRSILTSTMVGELALSPCAIFDLTETMAEAAAKLRHIGRGSGMVCTDGMLVGIFTERDLLKMIGNGRSLETPLSEVMTAKPQTVATSDSLFEAILRMDQGGYRRLPVLDTAGAPVGIVDVKTMTHFLVEHFPAAIYNQASHAQLLAKHREGA